MIDLLRANQCTILLAMSLSCLLLAGYAAVIRGLSARLKSSLMMLEVGVCVLLLFDALSYAFRGDCSQLGSCMVRVSNFMTFAMTCVNPFLLCRYADAIIETSSETWATPRLLKISGAIALIGAALVVASQFTGAYYTIGEDSLYRRGPLYPACLVAPSLSMILTGAAIWQNRGILSRRVLLVFTIYCLLPLAGAFAQAVFYGVSITNSAVWFGATVMFGVALLEQSDRLATAAYTDSLTGLPNEYGYLNRVRAIMGERSITEYCALRIEICRLGTISNELGKERSEEFICRYAHRLASFLDDDEVLGKSGERFDALIKNQNVDAFLGLLDDTPIEITIGDNTETLHVSARSGAYRIGDDSLTAVQIMEMASSAEAFASLGTHGTHVTMDEELVREMSSQREIEEKTERALQAREFEPFYQPKVNSENNTLCGAEALVRWRHDGVVVPPFVFVPVMERNGSILQVDYLMLEKACQDLRGWIDAGIEPVPISVNFSRKHLVSKGCAKRIHETVRKHGVPTSLIQVEITETVDDYPMSDLVAFVENLHDLGFKVAIDDFGTGGSSVSLLKFADFDVLKIDRSLVGAKSRKEECILKSIVGMAEEIGVEIVAEGVEGREQVDQLDEMGCRIIQGYYFDRPLQKDDFERRLICKEYLRQG